MNTIAMRSQMRTTALKGTTTVQNKRFITIALAIVTALLLAFIAPQHAVAQAQNTGTIFGTATDPSGAVIANATVTITSVERNASRSVTTNKNGEFTVQSVDQGTYTVTVTAPGFETYELDNLSVDANSEIKVSAKMTIGETTEIKVQASASDVDVHSGQIGTLIDQKLIDDLPVDGRDVVAMVGLLPGVTSVNAPTTASGDTSGPTYSAGGSRTTQNLFLFDGLMWNNLFFNTGTNFPPPNGLQEVSILLNQYKAQYGRNSGSVFNVITRTGTNTIHGTVWEYFNNQMFDAQDRINVLPSGKPPQDDINQFGATVGGPIKQDKIFYFITAQEQVVRTAAEGFQFTPDAHERGFVTGSPHLLSAIGGTPQYDNPCTNKGTGQPFAGMTCASFQTAPGLVTTDCYQGVCAPVWTESGVENPALVSSSGSGQSPAAAFSQLQTGWFAGGGTGISPCIAEANGAAQSYAESHNYQSDTLSAQYANPTLPPGNISDAVAAQKWPYAEVPTNCLNPMMEALVAKYMPIPVIQHNGLYEAVTSAGNPQHDLNVTGRIDWQINDKHKIDARYNAIRSDSKSAPGVSSSNFVGNASYELDHVTGISNFGNIGETWIITPNMVNTIRAGYKRYESMTSPTDNSTLSTFNPGGAEGTFIEPGVPVMPQIGSSGPTGAGLGSSGEAFSDHINEDIEILEQLAWAKGKHNFQFGANFLRLQYDNIADYAGSEGVGGVAIPLSDFAMGFLSSVNANSPLTQAGIQHDFFFYAQDDWRTTAKLTLNLGVRYELPFQWYQPTGYSSTFLPGTQSVVFPGAVGGLAYPGDPGVLKSLVPTDFNGLVPRVGFAYDVFGNGRLAVRGGFGMFFDQVNANVIGVGEPFYYQTHTLFPVGGATDPLCTNVSGTGGCTARVTIPGGFNRSNPQFSAPYSLFYPDRNFRTPYVEAFNIGFQYKLPHGGTLEADYVGKFSRKLTIAFDQNPTITDCTGGYYQANPILYGNSTCNGQATNNQSSESQRARYTQFNVGGSGLVDFASLGTGNYNALQTEYTQHGGKNLTMIMSYTYSKSFDLASDGQVQAGGSSQIPDPFNVSSERGLSDFDARHIFALGWSYDIPKLHGGFAALRAIVNNWNYAGIYTARTGQPLNVTCGCDQALDAEPNQRPEIVPGYNPRLPSDRHRSAKIAAWFNPNAFTYPLLGTFSTMHRNSFTGPAFINTNMSIGRYFPLDNLRKGMKLYFKADGFNVFNTPNLGPINTGWSCSAGSNISINALEPCLSGGANGGSSTGSNSIGSGFGTVQATTGVNNTTSSNGRKMTFSVTLYY